MSHWRGRPAGLIRHEVLGRLPAMAPARADEVASALQIPVRTARYTLSRLAAAGEVQVVGSAPAGRQAGRRPALYAVPPTPREPDPLFALVLIGIPEDCDGGG